MERNQKGLFLQLIKTTSAIEGYLSLEEGEGMIRGPKKMPRDGLVAANVNQGH